METLIVARDRVAMLVADLANSQTEETPVDDLIACSNRSSRGEKKRKYGGIVGSDGDGSCRRNLGSISHVPARAREIETYEEEYDKELFAIFLQQLQGKLNFLGAQTSMLSTATDKLEILEQCLNCINSLSSSANYMGYQALA